ncbi:hypothetical protein G9A89_021981 [Geosiphon pyriformis]|nr:hypothetical protein G9A89_021981 [Geosiphon pyriformis]
MTVEFKNQIYSKPEFPELFKFPTIITKNKSLDVIFPFELEELSATPLFNGATLEKKPITAMYTNDKVDNHSIKLILDSRSAGSIITRQLIDQLGCQVDQAASTQIIMADGATKTLIGEIDDFPIEVNGIIVLIKIPAICGHFKTPNMPAPLIEFEKEEKKSTWEVYQVLWADKNHNELPPVLLWNNNGKEKKKEEPTWNSNQAWRTNDNQEELIDWE